MPSVPDVVPDTPSVFVVSHHLDDLLRVEVCRFVAPCYQSWGPPRFVHRLPARSTSQRTWIPDRPTAYSSRCLTLQSFPLFSSRPCVTAGRYPLAVGPGPRCVRFLSPLPASGPWESRCTLACTSRTLRSISSTSGCCSTKESVALNKRYHLLSARCFHGLVSAGFLLPKEIFHQR